MRILITAGPTREYFDSVRFISNPSSGKMGYALAAAGARRGHQVVLVSGPVDLKAPKGVKVDQVTSAKEMFEASVARFEDCDAAILTAAVCDYRPATRLMRKLKKQAKPRVMRLLPTRDISAHLGRIKKHRVVVGFAMEDHVHHAHAESKLRRKRCDAIVLNGIGNVGSNQATVEILVSGGKWSGPFVGSKSSIASRILVLVEQLLAGPKVTAGRKRRGHSTQQ